MLVFYTLLIVVSIVMTKGVFSISMPPSDVIPNASLEKIPLDNATAASRGNVSSKPLVSDDVIDNSTSEKLSKSQQMLKILLSNQTVQQVVLETETKTVFKFEYQFNCPDTYKIHVLRVTVPNTRTLNIEENNENKIYIHCRDSCAKLPVNVNAKGFESYAFLYPSTVTVTNVNQSCLIQKGNINVTLIGGLIGISNVNFSVYSVDHENNTNSKVRVLGLYKLSKALYDDKATQQLHVADPSKRSEKFTLLESTSVNVFVVRPPKIIDTVFIALVFVMEVVQMIALGSLVELEDFKKIFRRPLATVAGLLCHYVIMTLLAYTVAKLLKPDYPLDAAGTFATGICPGSSTSNIYAYLLYGDLPLSLTITILSYLVSFAMIPLWTYTVGQEFFTGYEIAIPYMDLVIMLAVMLPSLAVGMLIRKKFPNSIDQVQNILTPVIILVAVGFLSTGIYASLYVFYLLDLKLAIIGCALSYIGYLLGAVIMLPFKRSRKTTITMTLEIGMKNTGIGFAFLTNTMPHPIGDIASVVTASVEVASQIPPFIVSVFLVLWELCRKKYKPVIQDENDIKDEVVENGKEMVEAMVKCPEVNKQLTQL